MSYYRPENSKVSIFKESGYRWGGGTSATAEIATATAYLIDEFEAITPPETYRNRKSIHRVGGSKTVDRIIETGYSIGDATGEFYFQHGRWFYYALGDIAHGVPTATGKFTITATDTVFPSFVLHAEQELTDYDIRRDHLGCVVKELTLTAETGEETPSMLSVAFNSAKTIDGSNLPLTATGQITDKDVWTWTDVATCQLANTAATYDIDDFDKVVFKVKNDLEIIHTLGREHGKKLKDGKREYELTMHVYPDTDVMYLARDLKTKAQTWTLDLWFYATATDYIRIQMTDMYMQDYPNRLPSRDDKILGLDVTLMDKPANVCTITVYNTATSTDLFWGA